MRAPVSKKYILEITIAVALVIASAILLAYLWATSLLPSKYFITIVVVVVSFNLIISLLLLKARKRLLKVLAYILIVIFVIGSALGVNVLATSLKLLSDISGNVGKKIIMSVIVLKDSNIQDISQLGGAQIGAVPSVDKKYVDEVIKLSKASGILDSKSYTSMVDSLYSGDTKVAILNEGYRSLISEFRENFDKDTRVIKTYEFTEDNKAASVKNAKAFNLYISGIDTFGNISTVSRSDVNIVATVNNDTHKVLLTTIPRDSYVTIPAGGANQKDKLTHAGIYGVDASIGALEQLLDIKIDAYMRINFTSLIKLVDEIDGITVNNPISFRTDSGQQFSAGNINLNGNDALTYSRERHNLAGSDNDRGKNQQRVITAILDKVTSPGVLTNYQGIMGVLGQSIQTNLTDSDISQLVNEQINYGGKYQTESIALTGKGQTGGLVSYAMPSSELYMYVLDSKSVADAHNKITSSLLSNNQEGRLSITEKVM